MNLVEEWKKLRQQWRSEDFVLVKKPNLSKGGKIKKRVTELSRPKRKFLDSKPESSK